MHITTGYENSRPRIEIIPLIDVVFLLMVFFVYAMLSMVVYRGLRVELPAAEGVVEDAGNVVIILGPDNRTSIDGRIFDMSGVIAETVKRAGDNTRSVLISGDRKADLGVAVELLAGLGKAGITAVSFQVQQHNSE